MAVWIRHTLKTLSGIILALVVLTALAYWLWVPPPMEPPYKLAQTWGSLGSEPGQFNQPTGVAVAGNEVFVSDARNHRIQVFSLDGLFKRTFDAGLERPMNLTVQDNKVFVADLFTDSIHVFARDGMPRGRLTPNDGLDKPGGVAVGPDGEIYIADTYDHRIVRLHSGIKPFKQWGKMNDPGTAADQFSYPTDVAVAPNGTLFVADGYNDRVQVFAPDGRFLRKWGGPFAHNIFGPFNGWFATATSIALGPEGNVFVADFYNDRIQKFTATGKFLTAFGKPPPRFGHSAIAVAVSEDGSVFVADFARHRIQKWLPANTAWSAQ